MTKRPSIDSVWDPPVADEAAVTGFVTDFSGLVGVDLARVSRLLLEQLVHADRLAAFSVFSVADVLQRLERGLGTSAKGVSPFSRKPLRGLLKAHFFDPMFMVQNLSNELRTPETDRKLEALFQRGTRVNDIDGELAHMLTVDAFERRASRAALT